MGIPVYFKNLINDYNDICFTAKLGLTAETSSFAKLVRAPGT